MAVFILKNTWGLDAGLLQSKFNAAITAAGVAVSSGAYQADNKVDTVFIDPTLNVTLGQIRSLLQKHGNGFTTCDLFGQHVVWFVVPESAFAAVSAIVSALKALA